MDSLSQLFAVLFHETTGPVIELILCVCAILALSLFLWNKGKVSVFQKR